MQSLILLLLSVLSLDLHAAPATILDTPVPQNTVYAHIKVPLNFDNCALEDLRQVFNNGRRARCHVDFSDPTGFQILQIKSPIRQYGLNKVFLFSEQIGEDSKEMTIDSPQEVPTAKPDVDLAEISTPQAPLVGYYKGPEYRRIYVVFQQVQGDRPTQTDQDVLKDLKSAFGDSITIPVIMVPVLNNPSTPSSQ